MNKAEFEPNEQIVDQGRVGFGDASQFNPIDFQGPVRVDGPFLPTLPFARLVVQTFTLEGSLFSSNPTGLSVFCISTKTGLVSFQSTEFLRCSMQRLLLVAFSPRLWTSRFLPSLPLFRNQKAF